MMWPMDQAMRDELAGDHTVAIKAELLLTDETTQDITELVNDGSVDVSTTETRRTLSGLSLVDESGTFLPNDLDDILVPAGNEVRLWRGVRFATGEESLVPIGTFRLTGAGGQRSRIALRGFDRSWVISGAKLDAPFTIASGTNYVEAIANILTTAYGGDLQTNFPTTDEVTATIVNEEGADPWTIGQELASNIGMNLFFDPMGVCTMTPVRRDDELFPDWMYDDSQLNNFELPGTEVDWDVTDSANIFVIYGENTETSPVVGIVYDDNASSPTRFFGPLGRRVMVIRDEKVTTLAQAFERGRKERALRAGIAQRLTVQSLVVPGMEATDLLRVSSVRNGISATFAADRFTIPLRAKTGMQIDCRVRLVTAG